MKIQEIDAKSLLTKSKLPDADYVVNPYTGCQFACMYCYASFMGRFVGEAIDAWGSYVYVKRNAVEVFRKDLASWSKDSQRHSSLLLSSVTDPYQGIEKKYCLTRGILEALAEAEFPGLLSILTKSPMVLRDTDVLKRISRVEIGMTVTTTDDLTSRFLEVAAPLASRRFETLKELHAQGFETYAFIGPLLPHFRYETGLLDELFARVAESGVKRIFVEHINLRGYIRERLFQHLEQSPAHVRAVYEEARTNEHRKALDEIVSGLVSKYGLVLRLNEVIYHNEKPSAQSTAE